MQRFYGENLMPDSFLLCKDVTGNAPCFYLSPGGEIYKIIRIACCKRKIYSNEVNKSMV
jgi:hypothetical protein